jgi:hypothetical protein
MYIVGRKHTVTSRSENSNIKIGTVCFSKTLVTIYKTIRCHNLKDHNPHQDLLIITLYCNWTQTAYWNSSDRFLVEERVIWLETKMFHFLWYFGFHKRWGIFLSADRLSVSHKNGYCSNRMRQQIIGCSNGGNSILTRYFRSSHQAACFKVTTKLYAVTIRIAEPRGVKTARNSHCSKTSNAVLLT